MKKKSMHYPVLLVSTITLLLTVPNVGKSDDLSVHVDFPGGSAVVESID